MKRILINATQAEELRVAMVDGQLIYDLDIEVPSREQKKSNIYQGVITRIEPSLEAAFVNYGAERHGFLPFKEISRDYFSEDAKAEDGKVSIKDAIKVDQEIIVQVEKEERGNKGAALTSFVSLAGRFLVAMPQNPRAGGVSRRIEGEDRDQVRQVMSELEMPKGMGVIARTAGVGRTTEEMQWDLDYLNQLWDAIVNASKQKSGPFLIYQESDIVIRALRDHYKNDIGEILIDSRKAFERAHEFMSMVMPNALHKLKLYEDTQPLFNRFQIESQIESAFTRTVNLPSGGAIVIDPTEALTSIDINSARATKGSDIEETALNTNLEAADEIARQLRIRDLGGLLVIDFIDMMKNKNQREVEQRLRRAVYEDRARVQIGRISRFGLLEMSRQRLRPSLGESSQIVCPRCQGQGTIRDVESLSLAVLRLLEEEALKENTGRILAKLPVECATYLLNEKRSKIMDIEDRCKVHCVIIPDPNLETPHFQIERVRDNDTQRHESSYKSSYELTTDEIPVYTPESRNHSTTPAQTAAVQQVQPPAPKPKAAPVVESPKKVGLISKIVSTLFGSSKPEEEAKPENKNNSNRNRRSNASRDSDNRNRGRNANTPNRNRNRNTNRNQNAKTRTDADSETAVTQVDDKAAQTGSDENRSRPAKSRNSNRNRNRNRNTANRQTDEQTTVDGNKKDIPQTAQEETKSQNESRSRRSSNSNRNRSSSGPRKRSGDNDAQAQQDQQATASTADAASPRPQVDENTQQSRPENKAQAPVAEKSGDSPAQNPASGMPASTQPENKSAQSASSATSSDKPAAQAPKAEVKVETAAAPANQPEARAETPVAAAAPAVDKVEAKPAAATKPETRGDTTKATPQIPEAKPAPVAQAAAASPVPAQTEIKPQARTEVQPAPRSQADNNPPAVDKPVATPPSPNLVKPVVPETKPASAVQAQAEVKPQPGPEQDKQPAA